MTLKEFKHLADLYGGDLNRWPAPAGPDAVALLDASMEARAILADAAALDALLDRAAPAVTDESVRRVEAAIAARLAAPAPRVPAPWTLAPPPVRFWPTAGLLAGMAVAGFLTVSQGLLPAPANAANAVPDLLIATSYLGVVR